MRKLVALALVMMMSGCANLKSSGEEALGRLTAPPQYFWDYLKEAVAWLWNIVVGFIYRIDPTTWF